ncbi:hypothetical protein [Curtobacterium sp. MCBA15_001]|uniref:hypothetical protein n=1 Tax=Curtobacterium sp. MCBA15_001 TaxID=1898731 RepID=UPI0008DDAA69|nr:hypothetical protein [Curtobacterium sp. MCBA15_001]OIH95407.1 hypothetical protein BIU90_01495 [Curtobacterium sp. MCBA15_001]
MDQADSAVRGEVEAHPEIAQTLVDVFDDRDSRREVEFRRRKLREAKAQDVSASAAVEWLAHAREQRAATIDLGSPERANSSAHLAAVAAAL